MLIHKGLILAQQVLKDFYNLDLLNKSKFVIDCRWGDMGTTLKLKRGPFLFVLSEQELLDIYLCPYSKTIDEAIQTSTIKLSSNLIYDNFLDITLLHILENLQIEIEHLKQSL